jgi:hypothetical protein
MSDQSDRLPRRAFVRALVIGSMIAPRLLAEPAIAYSVVIRPARALLGEPILAVLSCVASQESVEAFTFQDGSLELELKRIPPNGEPALVFPNRTVTQSGTLQIRNHTDSRKQLRKGERLNREVDLVGTLPRWMLDTGDFQISYQLGADGKSWRANPAKLTIESGPAAILALFTLLDHADSGVRARGAGLLHRMTAHIVGYGAGAETGERQEAIAQWRQWWQKTGNRMPWNFLSQGATLGVKPAPPPRAGRSKFLGGVAYERRALNSGAVSSAIAEWLRSPSAGPEALKGNRWIADQVFNYPREEVMLDPGEETAKMLESALSHLPDRLASASIILATIARMPDQRYIGGLSTLESLARKSSNWRRQSFIAAGLLDLLDPGRTPAGAV